MVFRSALKGRETDRRAGQTTAASANAQRQATVSRIQSREKTKAPPAPFEARDARRVALPRSLLNFNLVFFPSSVNGSCVLRVGTEVTCV